MASTEAETPSTVAELKAALDELGVEYDAKAKKPELEKLYAEAAKAAAASASEDEEPAGDGEDAASDGEVQDGGEPDAADDAGDQQPDDAGEASTEAETPSTVADGEVLLKPLMRGSGPILQPGDPVPSDLTTPEIERLQRLGVLGGDVEGPAEPRFDVFKGRDGQFYWHLVAANGEIVAQGEGYDSEKGAEQAVGTVVETAAAAALREAA